jgi:hypothetical protein
MVEQLERGLAGYERIAKHAVSAEGAAMIVAEVEDGTQDTPGRDPGRRLSAAGRTVESRRHAFS